MSEVKKLATREGYAQGLLALGEKYDNMAVLDADLAAATKTDVFKKAYPDRFIDCGIAEANWHCGRFDLNRQIGFCIKFCNVCRR